MKKTISRLILAATVLGITGITASVQRVEAQAKNIPVATAASSIVEVGKTANGKAIYNIEAHNVDLVAFLKALFEKEGRELRIDPDVQGSVDNLVLKNQTFDQLMLDMPSYASGTIRIRTGKITQISRTPANIVAAIQNRQGTPPGIVPVNPSTGFLQPQALGGMNDPLARQVTLDIPESAPLNLTQALARLQAQTQVPIRLHPSIPRDVKVSVQMIQVPLRMAINLLTQAGALKAIQQMDGGIMITPADKIVLTVGNFVLAQQPCVRCKAPVGVSWTFCPACGAQLPRRLTPAPAGAPNTPRSSPEEEHQN
jgi:hypothetical protein